MYNRLREIANHSILSELDVGINANRQGVWCQSSNTSAVGQWLGPPSLNNVVRPGGVLKAISASGQVGLVKNTTAPMPRSEDGLYQCIISDENGVNQTLVVGIYGFLRLLLNGKIATCTAVM